MSNAQLPQEPPAPVEQSEREPLQKDKHATRLISVFEILEMFALYFAIGMALLLLFFRHCPVSGDSMYPTLRDGDVLIVTTFGYTPKGGDIIVCQSPTHGLDVPLVKRVIATEGQTVHINYETWAVTVDDVLLDEDYINFQAGSDMRGSDYLPDTFTVPEGCLFVMGDNRNESLDSRRWEIGFIDNRYVLGRVSLRLLPFSEFGMF